MRPCPKCSGSRLKEESRAVTIGEKTLGEVSSYSIKNVKDYNCLISFHNGISELRNGLYYISPRALEKLRTNIGFDYDTRFHELLEFWKNEENPYLVNHYYKCLGIDSNYTVNEIE